jgi:hypothetical protein
MIIEIKIMYLNSCRCQFAELTPQLSILFAPIRPNKTAFSTMKLKQFAGIAIQLQQLFPE